MDSGHEYGDNMKNSAAGVAVAVVVLALASCAPNVARISDDRVEQARAADVPVLVSVVNTPRPNTAGGVDVHLNARNVSNHDIKYVHFTVVPYNNVGDIVASRIGGRTDALLTFTGPLQSGRALSSGPLTWRNIWYNFSIRCAELTNLSVTFMDDSTVSFGSEQIAAVLATPEVNNCR